MSGAESRRAAAAAASHAAAAAASPAAASHAAASPAAFTDLWRSVSKLCHSKPQEKKPPATPAAAAACGDLRSPQRRGCGRYAGPSSGDSPGDVEASQDIFWDSTSPARATSGPGLRNTRVVEISDIVNRIAPKDLKPKGSDSPLLQWIGDSAVLSTPEIPKPRARRKSSRQSSVEDLLKLARQFDENMQQDEEASERPSTAAAAGNPAGNPAEHVAKNPGCPSSSDQLEAELRALFDCSTQRVSGRLSQSSCRSACSQERRERPGSSTSAEPRRSGLESSDKPGSAAEEKEPCGFSVSRRDDFDDDWENDDLLNDSFVLALTQNPDQHHNACHKTAVGAHAGTKAAQCETTPCTNTPKPGGGGALQEPGPKTRTTQRSTFKLEPRAAAKDGSKSAFAARRPGLPPPEQKTLPALQPDRMTDDRKGPRAAAADSLWDDGDDDALFYQVCDRVERTSNSQPPPAGPAGRQENQDRPPSAQASAPLPISAARQAPCTFVRSNSLPGSAGGAPEHQGRNVPTAAGANGKSRLSQSFPGGDVGVGSFGQRGDSSGSFQAAGTGAGAKPITVAVGPPRSSKTNHAAFKRNVPCPAAASSKVFITSRMTAKCSAAEIERKKQEALARRRLRMRNAPKP